MYPEKQPWGIAVILSGLAILTLAVYANSLQGAFVFDDRAVIFQNPQLLNLTTFGQIFSLGQGWRQPVYVTYGLNFYLGGLNPFGYHVLSVLLHALNVVVVFGLLRRVSGQIRPSIVGSALFAVHPMLSGAVSYLAGRSSLLCGTFYFLSVWCAIEALERPGLKRWLFAGVSVLSAVLAWSTKQEAITIPILVAAYFWIRRHPYSWLFGAMAAGLSIAVVVMFRGQLGSLFQEVAQNETLVTAGFDPVLPMTQYVPTYLSALVGHYYIQFIAPFGLNIDPDIATVSAWYAPELWFAVAVLAALTYVLLSSRAPFMLRLGIAAVLLSPLSSYALVPLADPVQEHRAYITGLGVALLAAWAYELLSRTRPRYAPIVAASVLLLFGILTTSRNLVWRDSVSLWEDAARKSPRKARTQLNLGQALHSTGRYADALRAYERAVGLKPGLHVGYSNMAVTYLTTGEVQRARDILEPLVQRAPRFTEPRINLALAYNQLREPDRALPLLLAVAQERPDASNAIFGIADAYFLKADYPQAIAYYRRGIGLRPDASPFRFRLAATLVRAGDLDAARVEFQALTGDPALGADAFRSLGVLESQASRPAEARQLLQNAIRLRPQFPEAHHDLGLVLMDQNDPAGAAAEFVTAIQQRADFQRAYLDLATAYERLGQIADAVRVLEDYLSKFRQKPSDLLNRAEEQLRTLKPKETSK